MAKTTQPALYHDIEFHFLGGDEDSRLPGTVRIADGEWSWTFEMGTTHI